MKKNHTTYGYIVLPDNENTTRTSQMMAIKKYFPDRILTDREHKTKTDRTSLKHIIGMLKPDDVLVTTKLSNLGRSYSEILDYLNRIVERLAFIVTLEHPIVDTRPGKQGAEKTAAEFLSFLVEQEKERISKVTEGLVAARLRGVTTGRPKKEIPPEFYDIKKKWQECEISAEEAGRMLGIARNTFLSWARKQ